MSFTTCILIGTIPVHNPATGRLEKCDDPIVTTSSVNGYCLWDSHCRNLPNTSCVKDNNYGFVTRRYIKKNGNIKGLKILKLRLFEMRCFD